MQMLRPTVLKFQLNFCTSSLSLTICCLTFRCCCHRRRHHFFCVYVYSVLYVIRIHILYCIRFAVLGLFSLGNERACRLFTLSQFAIRNDSMWRSPCQ